MSTEFDPYHTWLGIPPQEQPPNHYRLLGIAVFESNPEVISNASDRQMMLLRTFQTGGHSALSQRLLNEVAAAKICLLNPDKKAAYDEQLRREIGQQQPARPPGPQGPYQTGGPPTPPPPSGMFIPPPPEGFAEPSARPESPDRPGMEAPVFDFQPTTPQTAHGARARRRQRLRWNSPLVVAGVTAGVGAVLLLAILAVWPWQEEPAPLRLESIDPVTVDEGELVSVTARLSRSPPRLRIERRGEGRSPISLYPAPPTGPGSIRKPGSSLGWPRQRENIELPCVRLLAREGPPTRSPFRSGSGGRRREVLSDQGQGQTGALGQGARVGYDPEPVDSGGRRAQPSRRG